MRQISDIDRKVLESLLADRGIGVVSPWMAGRLGISQTFYAPVANMLLGRPYKVELTPELYIGLAEVRRSRKYPSAGICENLPLESTCSELYKVAPLWPKHSGDTVFFIPHEGYPPIQAYQSELPKWEGAYGESRLEFLDWILLHGVVV